MSFKEENKNHYSIGTTIVRILKSPSNWLLMFVTYEVWSLLGMSYSSNQNFDMVVIPQYYILLVSSISILAGLININTKQVILVLAGAITTVISLLTIAISKVGVFFFGYPMGYYVLCPVSVFLFLWQIRKIICFAYCNYKEVLARQCVNRGDNLSQVSEANKKVKTQA